MAVPHQRRPWTSEASSSERGEAIMTPSPRSLDVHLARLDAAARLILRDPELARDAVQEALIRAWRDLPGLRDPDRFDAWLHRLDRQRVSRPHPPPQAPGRSRSSSTRSTHRRRRHVAGARRSRPPRSGARGASIPSIARSSPCTTCWGCRCRRWRRPWASRSGRPSRGCIDALGGDADHDRDRRADRSPPSLPGGQLA